MSFVQEEREASDHIRKQVAMDNQMLKEGDLGEQVGPTDPAGRNLEIDLETAKLEEPEETLVADPRGNLTPSQIVAQRLVSLLQTGPPGSSRWTS
jgi:hypothetical protein